MALPNYASEIPNDRRIRYFCRAGCHKTVYGKLNMSKSNADDRLRKIQNNQDDNEAVGISVECGKCSYDQGDWYNWTSEFRSNT